MAYDPRRRHEIDYGTRPGTYRVVQLAEPSPHPLTWASREVATLRDAYALRLRLQYRAPLAAGKDARLVLPGVSAIAFNRHHSDMGGCGGGTSLIECPTGECVQHAVDTIREILAYGDVVPELLGPDGQEAAGA